MEKDENPIIWRPSEIKVKRRSENNDAFIGNAVSWSGKSRIDVISEIRAGCSEKFNALNEEKDRWLNAINSFEKRVSDFASCIDLVMNGNGLDPEDDGYLPSLQQAITDVYGEPPSNDP